MNIMEMVSKADLLDYSQNLNITRNYLGDTLFPDIKTQHMKAEFYRLSDPLMLPTMAQVHALDTETHIGQRPTLEKVKLEKMFIKEQINQSERLQLWLEEGVTDANTITQYIFDDVSRLTESVKTRTEVMKMEAICTGKITVDENGAKFSIDYQVPANNKKAFTWSSKTADIIGDIQNLVDSAKAVGQTITTMVTSTKTISYMRQNEGIQTAIYSALGKGTYVSTTLLNQLVNDMFGIRIIVQDEFYRYEDAKGVLKSKRYFDENKAVFLSTLANGTLGNGLWGTTPEELANGPWTSKNQTQYITAVMYEKPDPVSVWTKAAGMFVPVLANPNGLFIGTVS